MSAQQTWHFFGRETTRYVSTMSKGETPAALLLAGSGLLTERQLCAAIGELQGRDGSVHARTIHRYEQQGMPYLRRGRIKLYDTSAVISWLRGVKPPPRRPGRPKCAEDAQAQYEIEEPPAIAYSKSS